MATLDQVVDQMVEAGLPPLPPGHPVASGKITRFGKQKRSWYVLHEIVLKSGAAAYFGSFGTWGIQATIKIETDWRGISDEERAEFERRQQLAQQSEAAKRMKKALWAASRAKEQWAAASPDGISPYVQRKQISAPAVHYQPDGTMLIPAVMMDGEKPRLVGLQKIAPDGTKLFNGGMAKQGACCPIGRVADDDRVLFLAEGYATGRSIRMATEDSLPGYVAFDAGNLIHVARMARARHPEAHLLFCADDDFLLEQRMRADLADNFGIADQVPCDGKVHLLVGEKGEYRCKAEWVKSAVGIARIELRIAMGEWARVIAYENAGLQKAHAAAAEVGNASVVWPQFADRGENKWTDFNDLHCIEGLEQCKAQIGAAILSALTPQSVKDKAAEQARVEAEAAATVTSNVVPIKGKKAKAKGKSTPKSAGAAQGGINPPGGDGEPLGEGGENGELRWEAQLKRDEKGYIKPTLDNVYLILTKNELWDGVIAFEEFSGQVVKLTPPPFAGAETGEWSDMDDLRAQLWVQQKYGFHPRKDVVMDAVLLAADLRRHHVVRSYLDPLVWDGIERLPHWMVDFLGADDRPAIRLFGSKWLIGAVARIYRPGCKVDNVLILEGLQGLFKSTVLKVLGGDWFTDAPFKLGDKDGYVVMRGKWIIELAELDSFNKAESNGAKQFFGQYVDRYRNFYGKRAADVPRQQAFAGTTNSNSYLKDETGNRRYWPVRCTEINLDGMRAVRDQLWAEAVVRYREGVPWWETAADHEAFAEEQDARYVGDAYTSQIAEGLRGKVETTMIDILATILKLDTAKWTKPEQQRIGRCMVELGWERVRSSRVVDGKRDWMYVRPRQHEAAQLSPQEIADGPI